MTDASEAGLSSHSVTRTCSPTATTSGTTISGSPRNACGERPLRLGLEGVVELVVGAGLELGDQRLHVDARRHRADRAGQARELAQVAAQRVAGARVLHLDRHLAVVGPAAEVHLADRRGGGRPAVEPDQLVAPVGAEVGRDLVADGLGRHRWSGVLEPGQLGPVRRPELVGQRGLEHRHRLAELHRPALELAQGAEQLLGGALLDLGHHHVGVPAAQPLAEPERVPPGVPQGQRRQPRGARDGLPGQLGHIAIVTDGWWAPRHPGLAARRWRLARPPGAVFRTVTYVAACG